MTNEIFFSDTDNPEHNAILECAKHVRQVAIEEVKAAGLDPSLVANVCVLAAAIMCLRIKEVLGQNEAARICLDALSTLVKTAEGNGLLEPKSLKAFH
jgi:hypothetical protein